MPIYTYQCSECGEIQEKIFPISDFPDTVRCSQCGELARKIITPPAIQCDSGIDVPWLKSACENLLPDGHRPIETRGEYKRYLKEHHIVERG